MDNYTRLKKKIRSDERYKGVRKLFKTSEIFQLPLDEYRTEVRGLFKLRKIRSLSVNGSKALDRLAEAIVQDQSYRSRMTEIQAHLTESHRTLHDLLERFHHYATAEYARDLKAMGALKERSSAIVAILDPYLKYAQNTKLLMEEIDTYIKDIDKAGFAFKSLVDTLGLLTQREYIPSAGKRSK